MNTMSDASGIIRRAENELRLRLLHAAEHGEYETARTLAEWANQLKQMLAQRGRFGFEQEPQSTEEIAAPVRSDIEADVIVAALPRRSAAKRQAASPTRSKSAKASKKDYPKFLRDGDELLKIGWSKREKKAYRHKAPKRVVLLVSQALQHAGRGGNRFAMEEILPLHDPDNDADVPNYQAYLSLAWIRKERLIVQHGRQGYSIPRDTSLTDAVEERWKLLAEA